MPPPMRDPVFEAQVQQVFALTGKSLNHIRSDLRLTRSVEDTVNRVFDGTFLAGTERNVKRIAALWEGSSPQVASSPAQVGIATRLFPIDTAATEIATTTPPTTTTTTTTATPTPRRSVTRSNTQSPPLPIAGDMSSCIRTHDPTSPPPQKRKKGYVNLVSSSDDELVPIPPKPKRAKKTTTPLPLSLDLDSIEVQDATSGSTNNDILARGSTNNINSNDIAADKELVYFHSNFDGNLLNDWNPSPKPEPSPKPKATKTLHHLVHLISDSDEEVEAPKKQPQTMGFSRTLSASTLQLLSERRTDSEASEASEDYDGHLQKKKPKRQQTTAAITKKSTPSAPKRSRLPPEELSRRASEKAAKAASKAAAADAKKREQDLASLNKLRTSKKETIAEMIADLSPSLSSSESGSQLARLLTTEGCAIRTDWRPALGIEAGWKLLKWRRNTKAEFDKATNMFIPLPHPEVRDENHVLVHLNAEEFVGLASPEDKATQLDLDSHVAKMKGLILTSGEVKVIYMVEGLAAHARKAKAAKNAAHRTQVLSAMGTNPPPSSRRQLARLVPEEQIEDALLRLQIKHGCLVHETANATESAEWMVVFTGDLSMAPYKRARSGAVETGFCADAGQVRTGIDAADTWRQMLMVIQRVTPAVAEAVVGRFPEGVRTLADAFEEEGEELLAGLVVRNTRSGAVSARCVGPVVSRRVCAVFRGKDPGWIEE